MTDSGYGNARFHLSDIYTATLDDNQQPIPGIEGATVEIRNERMEGISESGTSDAAGEILFSNLLAGYYEFRATAPKHMQTIGRIQIKPGATVGHEVFLDYDLVFIEWEVNEIALEDRYELVLNATYETDVPAPVVVIEPLSVNLPVMLPGEVFRGEFTITNYGLVRADDVRLELPESDDRYSYRFLSEVPDSIEAKQVVVVPYSVVKSAEPGLSKSRSRAASSDCEYVNCGKVEYSYECANGKVNSASIGVCWYSRPGSCGDSSGEGGSFLSAYLERLSAKLSEACAECGGTEKTGLQTVLQTRLFRVVEMGVPERPEPERKKVAATAYRATTESASAQKAIAAWTTPVPNFSSEITIAPAELASAISHAGSLLNTIPVMKNVGVAFEVKGNNSGGMECCKDCGNEFPAQYEETAAEASITLSGAVSTPTKPDFTYNLVKGYRFRAEVGVGAEVGLSGKGAASFTIHDTECDDEDCMTLSLGISAEIYGKAGSSVIFGLEQHNKDCVRSRNRDIFLSSDCYEQVAGIHGEMYGKVTGSCGVTLSPTSRAPLRIARATNASSSSTVLRPNLRVPLKVTLLMVGSMGFTSSWPVTLAEGSKTECW